MNDFIRKTKLYGALAGMLCLLVAGLSSCVQDELASPGSNDKRAVEFSIQMDGLTNKVLTRAASTRTDLCDINHIEIFLANGEGNIVSRYYRDKDSQEALVTGDNYGETGFVAAPTTFPIEPADGTTTGIKFRVGSSDVGKITEICVVANYMDADGKLAQVPESITTVEELRKLKQGGSAENIKFCTLFGSLNASNTEEDAVNTNENQRAYKVYLKRTVAMITLAIDGSALYDRIRITPEEVRLRHVPKSCMIGAGNIPTVANEEIEPFTFFRSLKTWGSICNENMKTALAGNPEAPIIEATDGPHGKDEKVVPLFMFENLQNPGTPNAPIGDKEETGKNPADTTLASYIEVKATYYYSSKVEAQGNFPETLPSDLPSTLTGTIYYRFWLGEGLTNSDDAFKIHRNKHYQLTLNLKNWGGLVEDGVIRTGSDGTTIYVQDGNGDASWRVITELKSTSTGDTIHVPANGSRVDIRLEGEMYDRIYNSHSGVYKVSYDESGNGNLVWAQYARGKNIHTDNGWVRNPTSVPGLQDLMFKNDDGSYTLHFYVKPYGQEEMENLIIQKNLHTVETWTSDGYRTVSFRLTGGELDDLPENEKPKYTLQQWLPMPVMKLEDGTEITDPSEADLYFSRFDIYDGEPLIWCREGMNNENLSSTGSTLITDKDILRIKKPATYLSNPNDMINATNLDNVKYDYKIGFHTTTAFFVTDKKNNFANIVFNNGHPITMMGFAFFAAANSELPSGNKTMFFQTPNNVQLLSHYGLATRTAWSRIEEAGVEDPRWPLVLGQPYWTSTIAQQDDPYMDIYKAQPDYNPDDWKGTKSMIYIFGNGKEGAKVRNRNLKYPGRMVYRKTDYAYPDLTKVLVK